MATPSAAFGGGVAEAIGGLGKVVQGAGDELFTRALALQQLQNEADAKEADTKYMIATGEAHAKFNALAGKAAVDALPDHNKQLQELRTQFRDGLGTDMARKIYDRDTLTTMGRNIFNAAGHAATQQKAWLAGASTARIDAIKDYHLHNPEDPIDDAIKRIEGEVRGTQAGIAGWGREATDVAVNKNVSSLIAARITGLVRTKPFEAKEMLEEYRDRLHFDDLQKMENLVQDKMYTVGARNLSLDVNAPTDEGKPDLPLEARIDKALDKAEKIAPDDPLFHDAVKRRVISDFEVDRKIRHDAEVTNRLTIDSAIMGMDSDGKKPTNVDELLAINPKIEDAWMKLKPADRRKVEALLSKNAKDDFNETPERRNRRWELLGLAGTPEGRRRLLDVNIPAEELPSAWRTELVKLQSRIRIKPEDDPRVNRAMDTMAPVLRDLNISAREDPIRYYRFRGAMQMAIEDWQEGHAGAQPKPEDVRILGQRLLREVATSHGWLGGVNKDRVFNITDVPDDERAAIVNDPEWKQLGVTPTEEMVRLRYIQKMFRDLHEVKEEPAPPTRGRGRMEESKGLMRDKDKAAKK